MHHQQHANQQIDNGSLQHAITSENYVFNDSGGVYDPQPTHHHRTTDPELVATDENGMKSVAYAKLTAVLIEAVKGLKAENEALKLRLERLENAHGGHQ